ncbi:MAG: hypothetical protein EHM51_02700 [Geobacter sp.]|nr:MAG: hypothetical protein EHM51_02700 [Geobacter sp.]
MNMEKLDVQTYSGFKADERPVSFSLGERSLQVREIVDRWYDVDHNYYKVLADDGKSYLLRHDLNADAWELVETNAGD